MREGSREKTAARIGDPVQGANYGDANEGKLTSGWVCDMGPAIECLTQGLQAALLCTSEMR